MLYQCGVEPPSLYNYRDCFEFQPKDSNALDCSRSRPVTPFIFFIFFSYRGSTGEDLKREKESETEIKAALAQSKRAMKFGDTFGAVSALEGVKQVTG